jgi:fumarylacetoacetase
MDLTDATHDPALRSWVPSANEPGTDFPLQNLPFGRFRRRRSDEPWRVGVAIGDEVLDLALAAQQCPWADEVHPLLAGLAAGDLAGFMAAGRPAWKALRAALSAALAEGSDQGPFLELCLLPQAQAEMALPCEIRNYSDFYAGIHHATAVGRLFRPDQPLLPNYKWVPIGYHGRASSVGLGGAVKRPQGQLRSGGERPEFGPSRRLDYELELGALVGPGTALGETLTMAQAEERLFGLTLLNDWSARDIQAWEYQPLGPFLSKSFATSISPWVVSMEALAPFRRPFERPPGDPPPLPYLDSEFNRQAGAIDITLEVWLKTAAMPAPVRLSQSNLLETYWTLAQLLTHHASNGCNLETGDLLGTGTISGAAPGQGGSLLELTAGGRQPLPLPGGQTRSFLQDGDTVTLRAFCSAPGAVRIGFGSVSGTIVS